MTDTTLIINIIHNYVHIRSNHNRYCKLETKKEKAK